MLSKNRVKQNNVNWEQSVVISSALQQCCWMALENPKAKGLFNGFWEFGSPKQWNPPWIWWFKYLLCGLGRLQLLHFSIHSLFFEFKAHSNAALPYTDILHSVKIKTVKYFCIKLHKIYTSFFTFQFLHFRFLYFENAQFQSNVEILIFKPIFDLSIKSAY